MKKQTEFFRKQSEEIKKKMGGTGKHFEFKVFFLFILIVEIERVWV
jgi:hypothetical protein